MPHLSLGLFSFANPRVSCPVKVPPASADGQIGTLRQDPTPRWDRQVFQQVRACFNRAFYSFISVLSFVPRAHACAWGFRFVI